MIQQGYIVELDPNKEQISLLFKSSAVHRKAYNWALEQAQAYKKVNGKYPSVKAIYQYNKALTALKDGDFSWFRDVSKCCHQLAVYDLMDAFQRFYRGLSKEPKFKSAFRSKRCFHFDNTGFKITSNTIKIPKVGYVKLKESNRIPTIGVKYLNATVSYKAGKWYVTVCIEKNPNIQKQEDLPVLGVDLGIKDLIYCSNGKRYNLPKIAITKINKRKHIHKRFQRKLSRQVKGSKRRSNTRNRMAVNYNKICKIKSDAIHKITTCITKRQPIIIIAEDLAVANMIKNHKLAAKISDCSFGEILRQLKYKSILNGGDFYQVDRFYPSSKTCSCCGNIKKDLKLSNRVYICEECGLTINRDLNAALNLKNSYKILSSATG